MAYKQQEFISHHSGGWEVQDQGASRFGVWWEPASWFRDGPLLVPLHGKWVRELAGVSFIRALVPLIRALPSGPNHLPKTSPPNIITLATRFQQINFGESKHSVHCTFSCILHNFTCTHTHRIIIYIFSGTYYSHVPIVTRLDLCYYFE